MVRGHNTVCVAGVIDLGRLDREVGGAPRVEDVVDPAVLRRDELVALEDDARVGILGAGSGRGVDRSCTEFAHRPDSNLGATLTFPQALVAELVDALG